MKIVRRIMNSIAISLAIYFAIALGLVFSQSPVVLSGAGGLEFASTAGGALEASVPLTPYTTRDGSVLMQRDYGRSEQDAPLLILLHGSGWHGLQFDALALQLSTVAHVVVPDLRGHGPDPMVRGDVGYLGQLEDDVADLIALHRVDGQKVVLAGHSSGGGLVVRFAGGDSGNLIDGAVLLAPFLKYNAPTTRPNSGGWAQPLTRRIIGLSMLNALNVRLLNDKIVIQFNFPSRVLTGPLGDTATTAYSYRLNTSFAPRSDYLADVAALPRFLLIAGSEDEAFVAEGYQPLMSAVTDRGRYLLVQGASHLAVVDAPETTIAMIAFVSSFSP